MNQKRVSRDRVRNFFAKRPWLRPQDYEAICKLQTSKSRHHNLSWFVRGYLSHPKA